MDMQNVKQIKIKEGNVSRIIDKKTGKIIWGMIKIVYHDNVPTFYQKNDENVDNN